MNDSIFKRLVIASIILLSCMIFVLSTGCNRKLTTTTNVKTIDSTIVNYHWRDTVIIIPFYRAELDGVVVKADTTGKINLPEVKVKSGRATVKVAIKDNKLTASANCDSLEQVIKVRDTEIEHLKSVDKQSTVTIKEKFIPKIYKWALIFSIIVIVLIIIRLVIFIAKMVK